MNRDQLKAEMDLFHEVLEVSEDLREKFITDRCAHDRSLADRLRRLLRAHVDEQPTEIVAPRFGPPNDSVPEVIDSYRIMDRIGEGGMGVVFLAEQTHPVRRRVAIKLIRHAEHSVEIAARFHAERQALALMNHECISRIIDASEVDGRPYFVMEYVPGAPITEFCDKKRLTIPERLKLFHKVCQAIHHAHQKGIIHRDLKPSNILVVENDGEFIPKIIDFGIAKAIGPPLVEHTLHTQIGQMIGTPEYMSPEQAVVGEADVDTRADVYSLGVILYELLVGVTPFRDAARSASDISKIQRIIREQEPSRPSGKLGATDSPARTAHLRSVDRVRLASIIRGDLDWITMRCLEKDRSRRYESSAALANDISAYLKNRPVDAGPPGFSYRLGKFVRRNTMEIVAGLILVLGLIGFAVGGTWVAFRERRQSELMAQELAKSEAMATFAHSIITGVDPAYAKGADTTLLKKILDSAAARVDNELADFPEAAVDTLNVIGKTLLHLGEFDQSESVFDRAAAQAETELGPEHAKTLETASNLAVAQIELSKFDEAVDLMENIVSAKRRIWGDDDESTIAALSLLGTFYDRIGRYKDAVTVLEPVLEWRRATLGKDHQDSLLTANNLSVAYSKIGRVDDAIELNEIVLDSQRRTLGEDHPQTLATTNNLASRYTQLGRFDKAEQMLRKAIEIKKRILERDHPSLLTSIANLGSIYNNTDRHDEALELYETVATRFRETLGSKDMRTIAAMNGMAIALLKLERYQEAEQILTESFDILRGLAGDDHPSVMTLHTNLLGVWVELGRSNEVLALIDNRIQQAETVAGPAHPATIGFRRIKALALTNVGRADEAEPLLIENYDSALSTHGAQSRYTTRAVDELVEYYEDLGRMNEAEAWRARRDE